MSQFSLWLYPLILSAALAIFFLIRHGIRWTWGNVIQQLLILTAASLGFLTGDYATWALVGWALFLAFNLGARMLQNRSIADLTMLRTKSAIKKARLARCLIWGPVGLFNLDMARAVDAIVDGDNQTAESIIAKWENSGLPRAAREGLHGYVMLGRVIQRDYGAIVAEYEDIQLQRAATEAPKKGRDRLSFEVFSAATRAYLELETYEEALQALEEHDVASYRTHPLSLDSLFLAYFSLIGAETEVRALNDRLSRGRHTLPEYSRLFWLGRCLVRRGEIAPAISTFQQALNVVSADNTAWKSRIEAYITLLEEELASQRENGAAAPLPPGAVPGTIPGTILGALPASLETGSVPPLPVAYMQSPVPGAVPRDGSTSTLAVINEAQRNRYTPRMRYILDRARYVNELIAPAGTGLGTRALIVSLVIVFLIGNAWQFHPDMNTFALGQLFTNGMLAAPQVMAGQYWRLFTYMFLHANISHLAMNVLGLVWFGKLVERLYGTPRFLLLYFACGLLSGVAHILSTPDQPAVGASGAIMGIFGAGTAAMLRLRGVIPANIRRTELIWLFSLAALQVVFDQVINLFAQTRDESGSLSLPRVASMAHLGGMVSGFLLGLIVPMSVHRRFSEKSLDVNRSAGK